jgi:signal transduction histidine kinase
MLHTEPRDIVAMVKEVYQNFQPKAEKRGIQYVCKTPDEPVVGNVDADGIFKIIGNLLDNAIKYCQSYTLLEVYTTLGKDGKEYEVVIKVSNDGKIIPEEERVYIFDAFYSAGRSSLFESTGIGLSLARSIALLHKGSLEYSTDGKFNIFTCVIPVA